MVVEVGAGSPPGGVVVDGLGSAVDEVTAMVVEGAVEEAAGADAPPHAASAIRNTPPILG